MSVFFEDPSVTLHQGKALEVLRADENGYDYELGYGTRRMILDASVDCVVTSPPYFGLRDYGVDGQQGLEATPAEYVAGMVAVFREVYRVLADDGTLWVNLGDSYAGKANAGRSFTKNRGRNLQSVGYPPQRNMLDHAPYKGLLGIPWRLALALQDDCWTLRNEIIWHKSNGMPESVRDRLASRHEHLFMLTKGPDYWFDLDPIREPHSAASVIRAQPHRADPGRSAREGLTTAGVAPAQTLSADQAMHPLGRNPGDVWTLPTQPFPGAHFAVMPLALAERCVQAGCKPGGVVLDPYSGSGTTGLAAARHGRRYVGIDLNPKYLQLSLETRLAQGTLV